MKKSKLGSLYVLPIVVWLTLFFLIPLGIICVYSFLKKGTYGGVELELAFDSFYIFTDKIFLSILWKTIYISVIVTLITVALSIPTAYYIARSKYKKELLFLIIIPFWTNFLIRIYSWIAILGNNGIIYNLFSHINDILMGIGIIDIPIKLLYNTGAVVVITVYTSLPFAILPLYAVIEKFDFSLIEAGRDLGATNRQAFFKIFIPNIKQGIITATIFTFVPSLGSYAVPKLVGGTQATMLGNIIAQHLTVTRNWPLASAISGALIVVTLLSILLVVVLNKRKNNIEVSVDE